MSVHETFRPSTKVKHFGIACTLFFAVPCLLTLGSCFLPAFVEVPVRGLYGLAFLVVISLAVWGSMLLMSAYIWAAYYFESFTIDGTTIRLQTMAQLREIDAADLESLTWAWAKGENVVFRAHGAKFRLDLWGYAPEVRLAIVRALRELVPERLQQGWPAFCFSVALWLRDGTEWLQHRHPNAKVVHITRKRYDAAFAWALAVCTLLATILGFVASAWPTFLVLPFVLLMWALLRYSMPPEGHEETHVTSTPEGRMALGLVGILLLFTAISLGLMLAGVEPTTAELISIGIAAAFFLPYFGHVYWTEIRAATRPDYKSPAERLAEAEEIWARGEEASVDASARAATASRCSTRPLPGSGG